ncbi:MAG: GPH family glycoside/pentoside/hexuronide:cation symporter [Halieaceae bacterium]|jgi:GPH family glycoside/pentoside/hexuronide:cation symporter
MLPVRLSDSLRREFSLQAPDVVSCVLVAVINDSGLALARNHSRANHPHSGHKAENPMTDSIKAETTGDAHKLPLKTCIAWGMGTLSVGALFNSVNVLLLSYLVDYVGITAVLAGSLIGWSKIYDAFIDPLVGHVSDRSRSPMGRRRPFLLWGGVLLAVASIVMFNVPAELSPTTKTIYVLLTLMLYATGYALFSVPYMAMPAEMTTSPYERSRLISFRVTAVAIASIFATFIGPVVIERAGGGQAGHTQLSFYLAALVIFSAAVCVYGTRTAPRHYDDNPSKLSQLKKFQLILSNRPFLLLLVIKLFHLMALAVTQASMPFLFRRVLGLSDSMLGMYFLLFYGAMMLVQFIWVPLSRILGKRNLFFVITLIYGLFHVSWYFVEPGEPMVWIYGRAVCLGAAAGGMLLLGQSLLPDTMEWDYRVTGLRREGMLAAVYTVFEKVAFALGAAVTGVFLGVAGYIQGAGMMSVEQPASAVHAIYLLASFVPMTLLLTSLVAIAMYKLDERALEGEAEVPA